VKRIYCSIPKRNKKYTHIGESMCQRGEERSSRPDSAEVQKEYYMNAEITESKLPIMLLGINMHKVQKELGNMRIEISYELFRGGK